MATEEDGTGEVGSLAYHFPITEKLGIICASFTTMRSTKKRVNSAGSHSPLHVCVFNSCQMFLFNHFFVYFLCLFFSLELFLSGFVLAYFTFRALVWPDEVTGVRAGVSEQVIHSATVCIRYSCDRLPLVVFLLAGIPVTVVLVVVIAVPGILVAVILVAGIMRTSRRADTGEWHGASRPDKHPLHGLAARGASVTTAVARWTLVLAAVGVVAVAIAAGVQRSSFKGQNTW